MLFVCYPKCSTCQRAKSWLEQHEMEFDMRDIKQDNPSYDELVRWHRTSGLSLKKFFNTSGTLYKS